MGNCSSSCNRADTGLLLMGLLVFGVLETVYCFNNGYHSLPVFAAEHTLDSCALVINNCTFLTSETHVILGEVLRILSLKESEPILQVSQSCFKGFRGTTIRAKLVLKLDNGPFSSELEQATLLLLRKHREERTCLVKPTATILELTGSAFPAPASTAQVMNWLNTICGTYLNVNGGLSIKGLHRRSLLENLFSPSSIKSSINLQRLTELCSSDAGSLRRFFYSGRCHDDASVPVENVPSTASTTEFCFQNYEGGHKPEHSLLPQCDTISHVPSSSEFFDTYISRSKPIILKGVAKQFMQTEAWTNDYFRSQFGGQDVHFKLTPSGEFEGVEPLHLWQEKEPLSIPAAVRFHLKYPNLVVVRPAGLDATLNEFLDVIENRSANASFSAANLSAYLEYTSVTDYLSELESSVVELPFIKGLFKLQMTNIWLSNGNTLGKLHFDPFENFLVQISGRKQFIIFEPHNNTQLYEGHILEAMLSFRNGVFHRDRLMKSTAMTMSPVDITKPDFEEFPLAKSAVPLNCTVDSNDILYLPAYWWHEVQSYPDDRSTVKRNLAFNFWYSPFFTKEFPCAECKLDVNENYRHFL